MPSLEMNSRPSTPSRHHQSSTSSSHHHHGSSTPSTTSSKSSKSSKSSSSKSSSSQKQYYLITNVSSSYSPSPYTNTTYYTKEEEIDLHAESWKLPYSIDDSDLTFDGKPLNMLYEENRWQAEHSRDGEQVW